MPANIAPATSPAASCPAAIASGRPIKALHPTTTTSSSSSSVPASTGATLTQKQWTVPPRPKPGRKPATDTPATKRKAQNRVAQRAFRERKAAKIGELEEQIEEIGKDHAAEIVALQTQVAALTDRLAHQDADHMTPLLHQGTPTSQQVEAQRWHAAYIEEKRLRENLEREVAILKGEAVSLPRRNQASSYNTPEDMPLGCSKCSLNHCQCLEDAIEGEFTAYAQDDHKIKRPLSPKPGHPSTHMHKKRKPSQDLDMSTDEVRLDTSNGPGSVLDGCGFCSDGTTCLCADLAADMAANRAVRGHDSTSTNLPSPPSEELPSMEIDFTHSGKPPLSSSSASCPNGPGSCTACQHDPERALFCKTLAASHEAQHPSQSPSQTHSQSQSQADRKPCAAGAACCRLSSSMLSTSTTQAAANSPHGLTISCAEAFNTLKRHPAFERASQDIGEWLPRLTTMTSPSHDDSMAKSAGALSLASPLHPPPLNATTLPVARTAGTARAGRAEGRAGDEGNHTAFEIETASILGVLRFFDRRFGRDS